MHQISPIYLLIEIEIAVRFLLRLSQCLRRGLKVPPLVEHYFTLLQNSSLILLEFKINV